MLVDLDSRTSSPNGVKTCGFNLDGWSSSAKDTSNSVTKGVKKESQGFRSLGRSLRSGVSRAVFPEDLKVSGKTIYDPQNKSLQKWNKLFVVCCILAVSVDPLFFYLPVVDFGSYCLGIDRNLAATIISLRTALDLFYGVRMYLQFRTAFVAPSSRVFGRGELVIDAGQIAVRYLKKQFIVDLCSVLPIPQIILARFFHNPEGLGVLATRTSLHYTILFQYIPRFFRILPLSSELKRTAGVFAETAWAGAAYYLLWYMLATHTVGAYWYLLAVERQDACWREACNDTPTCNLDYLYCGSQNLHGWNTSLLSTHCSTDDDNNEFNFGIFNQALSLGIVASTKFLTKYCYCLWWGLQNLSTLGQGLQTSSYTGEVIFSIALATVGLILFALLIGNMQTYLQSLTIRLEEMRVKRRDSEQWMHHRLLPKELRERVRKYDQYKWLETRGVDEENLVQTLPKDLRRDIKRHLCLALVRRVPLFENMDERLLDAICERLKPALYTEGTYIVREGDPVDEMLFIIRGRLESVTTDGGRSGFFNRGFLKEGDFCGEELLTWALDPRSGGNLPSSTRTVKALVEVEAFALMAEELKFVASQFRRLHSRQVQHTFRFYSQQWRTWAACFIQAAWRRYLKRKNAEFHRTDGEEEEEESAACSEVSSPVRVDSPSLGATIYASRFAANALRGVHRMRKMRSGGGGGSRDMVKLQKPPEPNFAIEDTD